jgi:hypothetical protein
MPDINVLAIRGSLTDEPTREVIKTSSRRFPPSSPRSGGGTAWARHSQHGAAA